MGPCRGKKPAGVGGAGRAPPRRVRLLLPLLLTACAPPGHLRPMLPVKDSPGEVGAGYALAGPRPVGQDEWAGAMQGWSTWHATARLDLAVVGAFDGAYGTAGLAIRLRALRFEHLQAGLGVELGYGWAALELPIAVGHGDLWIYSAPQYGSWGVDETVRVPLGLDWNVHSELHLRAEAAMNYPDFDPYQRRLHLGLGAAWAL